MYEDYENIKNLYELGFSTTEISKMLHLGKSSVAYALHSLNVDLSNEYDYRQYIVDDNFFNLIDTEEKAYIVGFIMADGYVSESTNQISITLKHTDEYILKQMLIAMNSNVAIQHVTNSLGQVYSRINICSKQMVSDLVNMGLVQNKSLILKSPPNIPDHLYHHLVRGYFDGDGSIWFDNTTKNYHINFVGTEDVLTAFREKMNWNNLTIRNACKNQQITKRMDYSGNISVSNKLEKLYKNATIYLTRKHEKYLLCKQLANKNK